MATVDACSAAHDSASRMHVIHGGVTSHAAAKTNPCGLTAPYLLYVMVHLWRWTLSSNTSESSSSSSSNAFALTHKILGYYAGLHLFVIYLFGAKLEGVSLQLSCPAAATLGLSRLDTWPWATWTSDVCLLFLFLSTVSKVCRSPPFLWPLLLDVFRCILTAFRAWPPGLGCKTKGNALPCLAWSCFTFSCGSPVPLT